MRTGNRFFAAIIVVMFIISIVSGDTAFATNGTRCIGFSSRDAAMGGATTASPADTSVLVKNPAGLVRIGNRVDIEFMNILTHDVTLHTEGALSNAGKRQTSQVDYIPAGNAGVSYRIPGTDAYPISVGCGMFTMAGISLRYASPRMNEFFVQDYDRSIDLKSSRIAPGLAVAFNDKLSFGFTGNIGIQGIRTDLATSISPYPETAGEDKWDFCAGLGFTAGLLYQITDMIGVGATYESRTWMGRHYQYKDSLPYIDEPPVISAGVSIKPIKNLELTYDTRYINWTDPKITYRTPVNGGFGWRDQWVFATGGEYTLFDKLALRLGYEYGRSQIRRKVVFANALMPLVMEHHLTTGFSYYILKNLSLDLVWEHHFKGVQSDDGSGDAYSVNGKGTKVTAAADIIGVGLGYMF
ncbi:MAG: outer membrane protein transport protein [Candidatus Omnitrophica bacterium]|nr:outer membrane protein transport protein [Candidatus Omnitrophota bacterium]